MTPLHKKSFDLGLLFGVVCFFVIMPFGMIFGVVHRLLGGTHRNKDSAF